MKNFAEHIQQHLGAHVESTGKQGVALYTIARAAEKLGTMKSGEKAPYVVMTNDADAAITMTLHPEHMKRLFNKGEDSGLRILADIAGVKPEEIVAVLAVKTADTPVVVPSPTVATTAVKTVKGESKKTAAIRIYNEVHADASVAVSDKRKTILARLRTELNMGIPGANTYHQNVKSGAWK